MASVKIVDLLLQSYNRKLGHKIGRFTIKSEALAALYELYAESAPLATLQQRISYWIIILVWWSFLDLNSAYRCDICCTTLSVPGHPSDQGMFIVPSLHNN